MIIKNVLCEICATITTVDSETAMELMSLLPNDHKAMTMDSVNIFYNHLNLEKRK